MASSTSEYLFLRSALFASFSGRNLPLQDICKAECIVLLLLLITATPVGANNKTLGLSWSRILPKNTSLIA